MAGVPSLVLMSQAPDAILRPADDIRGRLVRDEAGYEVGRVEDLLVNEATGTVDFAVVEAPDYLADSRRRLLPVEAIRRRIGDWIILSVDQELVSAGPEFDAELIVDARFRASVYRWYGCAPPYS